MGRTADWISRWGSEGSGGKGQGSGGRWGAVGSMGLGVSGVRRGQGLGVRREKGWVELGLDQHVGLCGVRGQRSGGRGALGVIWGQWGWRSVG